MRRWPRRTIIKVAAHPERRSSNAAQWSDEDRGIYIADGVAGGDRRMCLAYCGAEWTTICERQLWERTLDAAGGMYHIWVDDQMAMMGTEEYEHRATTARVPCQP